MKYIPIAVLVSVIAAVLWPHKEPPPQPKITFHFNQPEAPK